MISNGANYFIKTAVSEEYAAAIDKHGEFHSHHEGWAILREEVQEVKECMVPFCDKTGSNLDSLWGMVREDAVCENEAKMMVEQIYDAAEEIVKECIQVMAVCNKWMRLIYRECEE